MTVLVCGATGTTGSRVLGRLEALGRPVRALTRQPEAAVGLRDRGVDTYVGDLADPPSLVPALAGVDVVFVATAAGPGLPALEGALADAAARAGVPHLVKLSVIGAASDAPLAFARLHAEAEEAIRRSGVAWTFLRPNGFMQNTLGWAAQLRSGALSVPVADARWSTVDVRDVAEVAAAVLSDPTTHAGRSWTLTGPEALSARDEAAVLAELLGRDVGVREVTVAAAVEAMVDAGWPRWSADRLGELYAYYATGAAEAASGDVRTVTGREPRDYRTFATDHLDAFR